MRKIPIFAKVCECDRIRIRNIAFFCTNLLRNDKYVHLLTRLCCTLHTHYVVENLSAWLYVTTFSAISLYLTKHYIRHIQLCNTVT